MISRRTLLTQFGLLAAGGAAAWWLRDNVFWSDPSLTFKQGRSSGWLPFGQDDGVILVEGSIGGEPVRLLVDSGAQSSVIDRTLAARLGVSAARIAPVIVAFGVSGGPQLGRTAEFTLDLGALRFEGLRAAVLDLAPIATASRRAFDVVLGQDALRAVVADIDFPRRRIALLDPKAYVPRGERLEARLHGRELQVPVTVESQPLQLVLDTGASGALSLSSQTAEAIGLLSRRRVDWVDSVTFGGMSRDRLVRATTLTFAGETFQDVAVHVYEPRPGAPLPSGLVGVEALSRFRLVLDLAGGRLHRVPAIDG